jgi:hypothetical protein
MSIAQRTIDGAPEWYDTNSQETLLRVAALSFADDFIRHNGAVISRAQLDTQEAVGGADMSEPLWDNYPNVAALPWDTIDDTGQLVTLLGSPRGEVQLGVNAENQAQVNVLYFGDSLLLRPGNDLVWETRVKLTVPPTGEGGELTTALWGLASAHNTTADSIRTSAWFLCSGSGEIWLEADDNSTDSGPTQSGISMTADVYRIFRIAVHGTTVTFSVDGAVVGTMTLAAVENVQPYFRVSKTVTTANTTAATMVVNYFKAWAGRV